MTQRARLPKVVGFHIEAARRLGLTVRVLDPEYGFLFEIGDGRRRKLLIGGRSPLNDSVAARVAGDKYYTKVVLADAGFRVPAAVRCLKPGHYSSPDLDGRSGFGPGSAFAAERGLPLIVKPNRKSHGRGVVEVASAAEMVAAIEAVWEIDSIALVEEKAVGEDFRVDFLDGDFLIGYRRRPVELVGDARSTVRELLNGIDPRTDGETAWRRVEADPTWRERITARGLGAESVLPAGETIRLGGTVLNLHRWATAELIDELPPTMAALGRAIGQAIGLRFFGIDLKAPRLDAGRDEATIIEVNSSPLLTGMAEIGYREAALAAQTRVVQAIWETGLERHHGSADD